MIKFTPFQLQILTIGSIMLGVILGVAATYFIMKNIADRKKRRPTPFIESILRRYTDLMYDERYAKISDRQLIQMLRDNAFVVLWLATEASARLMRKVEKTEEKKT